MLFAYGALLATLDDVKDRLKRQFPRVSSDDLNKSFNKALKAVTKKKTEGNP